LGELERLLAHNGVPLELRPAVRKAWVKGYASLYVGDVAQFATRTGLLARDFVYRQYATGLEVMRAQFRKRAASFVAGRSTLDDLLQLAQVDLQIAYREAMLAVYGPQWTSNTAAVNLYRRLYAEQVQYYNNMVNQVWTGVQKRDGTLVRRTMMYANAAWGALQEATRLQAAGEGYTHEENILGDAEHCGGCVEETAKGRVPIGTLIPIGQRDCLANCRCHFAYS
jgi:hypothetical protein